MTERQALIERAKNVLAATGDQPLSHATYGDVCEVAAKLVVALEGDDGTTIVPPATARDMKIVDPRYTLRIEHTPLGAVEIYVDIPDHLYAASVAVSAGGVHPRHSVLAARQGRILRLTTQAEACVRRASGDDRFMHIELVQPRDVRA